MIGIPFKIDPLAGPQSSAMAALLLRLVNNVGTISVPKPAISP